MEILYPAAAMATLTALVYVRLASLRFKALSQGDMRRSFYTTYQKGQEPERIAATSRHVVHLFEMPVLFYVIVIIAFVTAQTGWLVLALAWAYVVLRAAHSLVHLTFNDVNVRFAVFGLSFLVLIALWIVVFMGRSVGVSV